MLQALRRARYRLLALAGVGVACGLALSALLCWMLSASLPRLHGTTPVAGISAPLTIERDDLGIPTLTGETREDLSFALGFAHAQDRLFQMDLMRRRPAGELSELVGEAALAEDRRLRLHRMRARARAMLAKASTAEIDALRAYTAGVNAGRESLTRLPWEYLALQAEWAPWREEDSLLVALGMYEMLQHGPAEQERMIGVMLDTLPPALVQLLCHPGSSWDAALDGSSYPALEIPSPSEVDLRVKTLHQPRPEPLDEPAPPGSNNWAASRRRTRDGRAIVACDMHLGLMVPGVWYRARLRYPGVDITGATLPGTPAMVVGSNGHVAWGFTNAEADTSDLVILEEAAGGYRTPRGVKPFEVHEEVIRVKGRRESSLIVEETVWGPVVGKDHLGRKLALRWVAHEPGAVNLRLMAMERCRSVSEALLIAPECGAPAQNLVVADRDGRIGWTILGRLPRRLGMDGTFPTSWADGRRGWDGFLPASEHPRIYDPPDGLLWTANNRTVADARIGFGSADPGARARQIRDELKRRKSLAEADMLEVQLDDRALFLERWQGLLLETLARGPMDVREEVEGWGGRAVPGSVGLRLVKRFRQLVREQVVRELCAPCYRADPTFNPRYLPGTSEDAVWALAGKECPAHLRPKGAAKTHAEAALALLLEEVRKEPGGLKSYRQGKLNRGVVRHPLSRALGWVGEWMRIDMPEDELAGDSHGMPRVQGGRHGASQRMAVSPGREEDGYFHTPAGQSGHFLSSYYASTHQAWVEGKPTPFLPGPTRHLLRLEPAR
jgi:penicillin amidase